MNWLWNKRRISRQDLLEMLKRIDSAYGIIELNEKEPMILETIKNSGYLKSVVARIQESSIGSMQISR